MQILLSAYQQQLWACTAGCARQEIPDISSVCRYVDAARGLFKSSDCVVLPHLPALRTVEGQRCRRSSAFTERHCQEHAHAVYFALVHLRLMCSFNSQENASLASNCSQLTQSLRNFRQLMQPHSQPSAHGSAGMPLIHRTAAQCIAALASSQESASSQLCHLKPDGMGSVSQRGHSKSNSNHHFAALRMVLLQMLS